MRIGEVKRFLASIPTHHSVLLLGPPGIGKSRVVREFAEEEAAKMGREFIEYDDAVIDVIKEDPQRYYMYLDLRLTEVEPSDLIGLPRDLDGYVMYKQLAWSYTFSLPGIAGLVFLDEITNVRRDDLLSVAFKLTLDRRAGFRKFSDLVRVIAAGNTPEHSSISNLLPAPLVNRFVIFSVDMPTIENWIEYVQEREGGVDPRIAGYLMRFKEDLLHKAESETLQNFPTPRSWSRLNEILRDRREIDEKTVKELAEAYVGPVIAPKFAAFCRIGEILPEPRKILENPEILNGVKHNDVSKIDILYYAVSSIAYEIATDNIPVEKALPFIKYLIAEQSDLLIVLLMLLPKQLRVKYLTAKELINNKDVQSFVAELAKYL